MKQSEETKAAIHEQIIADQIKHLVSLDRNGLHAINFPKQRTLTGFFDWVELGRLLIVLGFDESKNDAEKYYYLQLMNKLNGSFYDIHR